MSAEQKRAWLGVVTAVACLVGYLSLLPFLGPRGAFAAFGLYGLNGLAPLIGRKERSDERDRAIARRASLIGFAASYLTFVFGSMIVWFVAFVWLGRELVSVHVLPTIVITGAIHLYLVRSIAILVLYGRHVEAENA